MIGFRGTTQESIQSLEPGGANVRIRFGGTEQSNLGKRFSKQNLFSNPNCSSVLIGLVFLLFSHVFFWTLHPPGVCGVVVVVLLSLSVLVGNKKRLQCIAHFRIQRYGNEWNPDCPVVNYSYITEKRPKRLPFLLNPTKVTYTMEETLCQEVGRLSERHHRTNYNLGMESFCQGTRSI